jgi:pimeloyl-ACP methyl ester carboxylesterase
MSDHRTPYDEFGLFHENAAEFGLPFAEPPVVRRERVEVEPGRELSALIWGTEPPEALLIHGGAQNAHTWDTVALAYGRPLVAVDLPGHGHSDGPATVGFETAPVSNARDVAVVAAALAPGAEIVVGMSLGGLTAIALTDQHPELVKRLLLVDVTPGVTGEKAKAITDFVRGPATFPSFDDLLARTIEHNPTRTESSLRRGILHNALQLDDGSWVWRHRRSDGSGFTDNSDDTSGDDAASYAARYEPLWDALERSSVPVTLARGMRKGSVVDDGDVAELSRRRPEAVVVEVAEAGHSLQGDTPLEMAEIIRDAVAR